jgi:hypothetical protein
VGSTSSPASLVNWQTSAVDKGKGKQLFVINVDDYDGDALETSVIVPPENHPVEDGRLRPEVCAQHVQFCTLR